MVGIGPGSRQNRTIYAERAILGSTVVAGYDLYLDHIADLTAGKQLVCSGMRKETERCRAALKHAVAGEIVSLVSSGDAGIYGMAGLAIEIADDLGYEVDIEIIPGVTAASMAAALIGAPLMLDFACISLSDLLVPWNEIRKRLNAVAAADFVVALYNPKSKKRVSGIEKAASVFKKYRSGETPVGVCTALDTEDQKLELSDLDHFLNLEINMRSIVIVGNSTTKIIGHRMVTPRGYR